MDRTELCNSLIVWMNTFSLPSHADVAEEFADGVLMMHALHQISPTFFDEAWMSKIKKDVGTNWRLRVSNLKKVLKGILDFYSEVLGQQVHDFHLPDVQVIGEHVESGEMGRLLQLILGCAVNCEEKQEYIQRIMGMEESVQHSVMRAIQELMTKEVSTGGSDTDSELQNQLKKTQEELNKIVGEKDELAQRCHVLDQQVSALQEEKGNLEVENEKMNERLNQHDSLEDPSTPAGRRYQLLQNQVEQFQLELERSEVTRLEQKNKMEAQEREVHELKLKNEELNELAEEARAVKDEIEILRYTSDKVAKYEATIESYKKKLEELSDLKGQIKILDEKNTFYMEKNMELEEELKKSGTFKSQLEMYKSQFKELQNKCTEESDRATKSRLDYDKLNKTLQTVQREKERLAEERDSLKEAIDNLEGSKAQEGMLGGGEAADMSGSAGMLDLMSLPQDVKEKFIRLQHENKMLKLKQAENEGENSQLLQTMLEDANERKGELDSQVRTQRERILELEAQVEDLSMSPGGSTEDSSSSSSSAGELRRKLQEATEKAATADTELSKLRAAAEERDTVAATLKQRATALQDELRRKDEDMRVMEEKYKRYLDKARSVSTATLAASQAERGGGDVAAAAQANTVIREQLQGSSRHGGNVGKTVMKEQGSCRHGVNVGIQVGSIGREESKCIQVGNDHMAEHVLKAKIEGLQAEVREYRREIREAHGKYLDGILHNFQQDQERFQSPAKLQASPQKAFSEKFRIFENRCKSMNAEESLVLAQDGDDCVVKRRPHRTISMELSKKNTVDGADSGQQQEVSILRSRVRSLEQELFIASQQVRVVESDLMNREHELRAMESRHKAQMERAMYFSPAPSQTDAEKHNIMLQQQVRELQQQLQDTQNNPPPDEEKEEKDVRIQQLEAELQQAAADLQKAHERAAELQKALHRVREEGENKEVYYKRILEKLRKEMRKANNPTSQMFGWFLKRESW